MTTFIEQPLPVSASYSPARDAPRFSVAEQANQIPAFPLRAVPGVETYSVSRGTAAVYPAELLPEGILAETRLSQQICDHRYYELVHRSLGHDFPLSYIVLRDRAGRLRGAQPFFVVDQDILAGMKGKVPEITEKVRQMYPGFLKLKTMMLGNPAGPGAPGIALQPFSTDIGADHHWFTTALGEAVAEYGRRHGVKIVVFKDVPAEQREAMRGLAEGPDFMRIPSMPMTRLPLGQYTSFEDYMSKALSKVTRKSTRRKLKDSAGEKIEMSVTNDVSDCVEEVHRLYLQVYERAGMKFEKLTPQFFLELGRSMPERARFFLWRRRGELIAVSITLVRMPSHPDARLEGGGAETMLLDLYLGMEYPLALDLHMYFLTMRDVIQWCIENGISTYYSTPLNYDAKLHLKHELSPLDLWVRHASSILNPAFKFAMRFAEPTKHDKIIPLFPNVQELHD
ncbi:MAG TPA: GNAT family N-acetyltransferase [Phycisphaerae bacterium]|nr:GNAT family N-acetyltransferase [Phycisphaerae bacterium]